MTLHRTSTRENGWLKWMDVQYCEGSSPPSLCHSPPPPTNVSKQNYSKAIHLSKDSQKERKKERNMMKKKKIEHLAWLSAEIAFGIIIIKFQNKYSILYSIYIYICVCVCVHIYIYIYMYIYTVLSVNEYTPFEK